MFVELALAVTTVKVFNYLSDREVRRIKEDFKAAMMGAGIKNKLGQTFKIKKIFKRNYGYKLKISIPKGLALKTLEDKRNILEDNLNKIIRLKKEPFNVWLDMIIINKDIGKYIFKPVKQQANMLYIGMDGEEKAYFIDLKKDPMVLICGKTGYGKTMLLSVMLANLIYNCPKEVEIWMVQLIKGELGSFEFCKQVKFYAENERDAEIAIEKVRKKLDERTAMFKEQGIRNINQWNMHYKKNQLKRIFLVCEEMSELIEHESLFTSLWGIAKAGRSVGIHLVGALQRVTHTNINTNVRSQMTKITFRQNNEADSKLTIGNNRAMTLEQGECIVDIGDQPKIKVPFIDDDFIVLNKYVPEIKVPSKKLKRVRKSTSSKGNKNNDTRDYDINKIIEQCNKDKMEREEAVIVDVPKKDIKYVKKKRKGVVSLEDVENADRKR